MVGTTTLGDMIRNKSNADKDRARPTCSGGRPSFNARERDRERSFAARQPRPSRYMRVLCAEKVL